MRQIAGEPAMCILSNLNPNGLDSRTTVDHAPIPFDRGPTLGVSKSTDFVFPSRRYEASM